MDMDVCDIAAFHLHPGHLKPVKNAQIKRHRWKSQRNNQNCSKFGWKLKKREIRHTTQSSVSWQFCSLPTPRKFQEQECPPSPEPTRKEKDKSGCHCVIVWAGLITVTHAATLYHPPTHSAWHHILSGWLTAAFSTCMTSDSLFWDTLTRNCCPQDITMDNWQCQILTPLYLQP